MRVAIRKWGNSLAVRLPRGVARDVDFTEGVEVDLTIEGKQVVITKADARVSLAELVAAMTTENLHAEVSTGARRGREGW
jgi:antitoxin MazE